MCYQQIKQIDNEKFIAYAPAKLNINLDIGEIESSGMHRISSIMQTVSLHDVVTLDLNINDQSEISGFFVNNNIVTNAMMALENRVQKKLYCNIRIDKSIPIAAGMGGGSSDAAAVLRLANRAFKLGLDLTELEEIASSVGNDVSFLIRGGRAHVSGGQTHNIVDMKPEQVYYIIARPEMKMLTKQMYELHDKTGENFTQIAARLCAQSGKLLESFNNTKPLEYGVTGKGPTVFAGYRNKKDCYNAIKTIEWFNGEIFIEHSVNKLEYK